MAIQFYIRSKTDLMSPIAESKTFMQNFDLCYFVSAKMIHKIRKFHRDVESLKSSFLVFQSPFQCCFMQGTQKIIHENAKDRARCPIIINARQELSSTINLTRSRRSGNTKSMKMRLIVVRSREKNM